jgi:2-hydroxy-3-oxopropionate reductase
MRRYGFIGLGIMGKPMCKNLLQKTGGPVVVHDLNDAPVEELVALGAQRADCSKAVAAQSDVILTMLPNSPG